MIIPHVDEAGFAELFPKARRGFRRVGISGRLDAAEIPALPTALGSTGIAAGYASETYSSADWLGTSSSQMQKK